MLAINLKPQYAARTVGDSVYLSLREDILSLRLKPGAELSIKDVADSLQISRSPVRDALMRLASESLVDIFPQRGCRVSLIDLHRVEQELFLREGLEILALKRLLLIAEESDFGMLARAIAKQERDIQEQNCSALLDHDEEFHGVFFEATNQAYARQILQTYCVHYRRIRLLSSYYDDIAISVVGEHQRILDALRNGDKEECIRLESEHLHRLNIQQGGMAERNPEYFQK